MSTTVTKKQPNRTSKRTGKGSNSKAFRTASAKSKTASAIVGNDPTSPAATYTGQLALTPPDGAETRGNHRGSQGLARPRWPPDDRGGRCICLGPRTDRAGADAGGRQR